MFHFLIKKCGSSSNEIAKPRGDLASPAAVMAAKEEAVGREDVFRALLEVLNGPGMKKSMAVGRPGSSPGAVGGGKMMASAGRYCVPKSSLLA